MVAGPIVLRTAYGAGRHVRHGGRRVVPRAAGGVGGIPCGGGVAGELSEDLGA